MKINIITKVEIGIDENQDYCNLDCEYLGFYRCDLFKEELSSLLSSPNTFVRCDSCYKAQEQSKPENGSKKCTTCDSFHIHTTQDETYRTCDKRLMTYKYSRGDIMENCEGWEGAKQ